MTFDTEYNIGDNVFDMLTLEDAKIIGITFSNGYVKGNFVRKCNMTVGYWINNQYLDGGRHPWEISKLKE